MPRRKPPSRRSAQRFDFHFGGFDYSAGVGYFPDGELCEIFLSCGKVGSPIQVLMLEASTMVSIALQYGAKPQELYDSLPKTSEGEPESPVGALLRILSRWEAADIRKELLT